MPCLESPFSKSLENYSESEAQDPLYISGYRTNDSSFPLLV